MRKTNRFRILSTIMTLFLFILLVICEINTLYFAEAFVLIALFITILAIIIKNRCPNCKRMLPLSPPLLESEEYCRHCGSKIE